VRYLNDLNENRKKEKGATMVEYALMVALIAVVAMVGAQLLGANVLAKFNAIAAAIGG
jgi:pilus assembly protein Flp/PilA